MKLSRFRTTMIGLMVLTIALPVLTADVKISALTGAGALAGADNVPVVQGGVTKKATMTQVQTFAVSGLATVATSGLATDLTSTLGETHGGTGQSTITQGDVLYGSAANTLAKLAKSTTATHALLNTGASNSPAWGLVPLATGVSGFLPQDNGGTQFIRLAADITAGLDDTFRDVTGVSFAIAANATYEFEFVIAADSDASTTGIDISVNGPASPTSIQYYDIIDSATGTIYMRYGTAYDLNTASTTSNGTAVRPFIVKGTIVNGANAGTLIARIKRESVGTGPNVRAGSYGTLRRIA